MTDLKKYAIIVAGGVGSRSGDSLPKQFHDIAGHPMLWWTLRAFHKEDPATELIVVMHPDYIGHWKEIRGADCVLHETVAGGRTRTESVASGLALIPDEGDGLVAVHDAARPLVSERIISEAWECAKKNGTAVPAIPVSDSLRKGSRDDNHSVDRSEYFAVQTPQTFDKAKLKEGYRLLAGTPGMNETPANFSDDATLMELAGYRTFLTDGDPRNIKVTYPGDFRIAEQTLTENRS